MDSLSKTLIVEDQEGPLEALVIAIRLNVLEEAKPVELSGNPQKELEERGIDVARDYSSAERLVKENLYKIVFLDHNLPKYEGSRTEDVGYGLIPKIRDKSLGVYIVGTSSNDNLPREHVPDCHLDKSGIDVGGEVGKIFDRVDGEHK